MRIPKTSLDGVSSKQPNQDIPFRVLGVALVVDQRGSGARLVARYPAQPSGRQGSRKIQTEATGDHHPHKKELHSDDELFFSLTARQMAKLFRTKRTLCGNPMTLAVNGTIFCCRAVLMHGDEAVDEDSISASDSHASQLVLFSVIVAMSAPMSHTSVPFSSWLDTASEDQLDIQRYIREATTAAASTATPETDRRKNENGRVSSAFLSMRRVHISLARYCRVLEREERRCHYISLQANQLFKIRNECQKQWEEQKAASMIYKANKSGTHSVSSSASVMSTQPASGERRPRHRRSSSFSTTVGGEDPLTKVRQQGFTIQEEQEKEQETLELMLAASPPATPAMIPKHHGNLVQELVQVFHSLSRNDHVYPQTPTALLIEREGVVYVNRHIAIPVEAASLKPSQIVDSPTVRPYYTLLFPYASPSALLQAFQSSGSVSPQRFQQLLLTVNAQKPLTDIAIDANLPLYTTLELASYLVKHGASVMSPVVSRQSRLACLHVERIAELGLEFAQLFSNVHLFRLVGFLTLARTLGEAISILTNPENEEGSWLRDCLAPSGMIRQDGINVMVYAPEEQSPKGAPGQPSQSPDDPGRWAEEMEEQLYAMAVWLLSRRVLTQVQEYFVFVGADHDDLAPSTEAGTPAITTPRAAQVDADENLFRELLESDFLDGDVSIMALSWRLGLDQQKVRSWGLRHRRIRVVSRVPKPGDDWDP